MFPVHIRSSRALLMYQNRKTMNQVTLSTPFPSKGRLIAYWAITAIIVLETSVGAQWDLGHNPHVDQVLQKLGYPLYILSIMGVWKIFAVIALLIPGYVRLKEWAYAGLFFVYSGAALSHFAIGSFSEGIGPFIFSILVLASWLLRPSSRRLHLRKIKGTSVTDPKWPLSKKIICWVALILLEFSLLSAGILEISHFNGNVEGIVHQLGYPLYFLTIQGSWKILAGIALAWPHFRVLKEWAYAGVFFSMTGAAISNLICHQGFGHLFVPLFIAALCLISWAIRPEWRKVSV